MASISICCGENSHRQAWTRQPFFEKRYLVCLVLGAMFADGVRVCAHQLGVCQKTVGCLRETSPKRQLLLRRLCNGVSALLPWGEANR